MSRYSELKAAFDRLDKEYSDLLVENLDLKYRLEELDSELSSYRARQQDIENIAENTRRLKHDMRNHIMVIASYLSSGETQQAKEYLSVVLDKLDRVYSYIQTGNSVMNYIINTKLEYVHRNGVKFKAEIENISFAKMGSVDFSALLSNILDNAVEASIDSSRKLIYISVCRKKGWDCITVKNGIDRSVLNSNPELISTKPDKDKHGIGIQQIKAIVTKYDGMIDIYESDGMFIVSVMIPSE